MRNNVLWPRIIVWVSLVIGIVFQHTSIATRSILGATNVADNDGLRGYRAGLVAFRDSKWAEALRELEPVARDASGYLRLCATNMVGQAHRLQGRAVKAQAVFASVAQQARTIRETGDPSGVTVKNAAVLELLALHYQAELAGERQEWNAAISFYEQLLSMSRGKETDHTGELCASPALLDKVGRLYWRTGQHDKARDIFKQSLERWPKDVRAPLLKLAIISLDNLQNTTQEPKLAFLLCELSPADVGAARPSTSAGPQSKGVPVLPDPPNPARDTIERLLKELPNDDPWRPVMLIDLGWMMSEVGKHEESAATFAEAAKLASRAGMPRWALAVKNYAELSRAIALLRQGQLTGSAKLTDAVIGRDPVGHAQTVATSIAESLARRQSVVKVGAKCDVKKLK